MADDPTSHAAEGAAPPDESASAEILACLVGVLWDELGVLVLGDAGSQTFESLGVDSLSMVELVMVAEDRFSVSISDGEIRELTTLQDVVELVRRKRSGGAKP